MINYFNFKRLEDKILITNDNGYNAMLSIEDFSLLVKDKIDDKNKSYRELVDKKFILPGNSFVSSGEAARELYLFKGYLRASTSLHIFVLTNSCNMHCQYCQAQSELNNKYGFMTKEVAKRAVDIALSSPDNTLTFEMQGGEPLLNFDVIRFIVSYAEENKKDRTIFYTITTNGTLLSDEIIAFFEKYKVSVSLSLDGSRDVQMHNRPMNDGGDSFSFIEKIIPLLKKHNIFGGFVLTTTNYSLDKWREIIDTYILFGCYDIFLRTLTPLGYANDHWDSIGYNVDDFLAFYEKTLSYILKINKEGIRFRELHAMFFLRKIITQQSDNYMELRSPCGATIGQVAYYYDGNIYTCDEGRMISQMGDEAFCLGNVWESTYSDLIGCESCKAVCKASVLESLPGCADCVYSPYCGTCPATTYALEHSLFSRTNNNYRCKTYKGMLDIIFRFLQDNDNREIFESWVRD